MLETDKKYRTILIDPPWEQKLVGKFKYHSSARKLPYNTMTFEELSKLPIKQICMEDAHIWLWTSNQYLPKSIQLLERWGLKYLSIITWVKDSGIGAWFANNTQHLLFAYNEKCLFLKDRYKPTGIIQKKERIHSRKPHLFYTYIEGISSEPRIELFARHRRDGWDCWGNEVPKYTQKCL